MAGPLGFAPLVSDGAQGRCMI